MSNAISPLAGRVAAGEVTVRDAGLRGMITLRSDLSAKPLRAVCKSLTGQQAPERGRAQVESETGLCWMSPDELLVLVPYAGVSEALVTLNEGLAGTHYLAENVSDARALITVEGPHAREVLAKLTPVDLHPDSFRPGMIRRSKLAQAAAAFWMPDEETFEVICFRSVAEYVFNLLENAAKTGSVGHLVEGGS